MCLFGGIDIKPHVLPVGKLEVRTQSFKGIFDAGQGIFLLSILRVQEEKQNLLEQNLPMHKAHTFYIIKMKTLDKEPK